MMGEKLNLGIWERQKASKQNLTFIEASLYFKGRNLDFETSIFPGLGIIDDDGDFTNLALLISDNSPFEIKFACYDENTDFIRKKEFKGSIIKILDHVLDYADLMNTTSAKILPYQAARLETQSFPMDSLKEAIINAICHADYGFPSNIKVEFFPNKARVSNPGATYLGSLSDALKGGQSIRNPGLINIFHILGFNENKGSRISKIMYAYRRFIPQPVFHDFPNCFIVELPDLNYFNLHKNK